jgi:6-pyruvoyltetrahydropterin 2'-reductase
MTKEKTIRYSEIFYSFQGEAELAGKPSVWLRFFGCNLECNGFGQDHPTQPDTHVLPFKTFDISTVTKLEDLPVWHQGCDSSYSWSAKYKKLVHNHTVSEIADLLMAQMVSQSNPLGEFVNPMTLQDTQLAFTGGEPMLNQQAMIDIVRELAARNNCPRTITVETNATKPLSAELKDFLENEFYDIGGRRWHWAMSPKMHTVSGEVDAVLPEIIFQYAETPASSCLKFVMSGTAEAWDEMNRHMHDITRHFRSKDLYPPEFWIMPVGATKEQQELPTVADISMEAMRRGYNVATRNHCYVFGNTIGK